MEKLVQQHVPSSGFRWADSRCNCRQGCVPNHPTSRAIGHNCHPAHDTDVFLGDWIQQRGGLDRLETEGVHNVNNLPSCVVAADRAMHGSRADLGKGMADSRAALDGQCLLRLGGAKW